MSIISPQERLNQLPFEPTQITTELSSPYVRLEDYKNLPPSDLSLQPMAYHIIAFHYKPPTGLLRHRCGEAWSEREMAQFDVTYVPAFRDNQWQFEGDHPHCLHILLHDDLIRQTIGLAWEIDPGRVEIRPGFQLGNPVIKRLAVNFHRLAQRKIAHDEALIESLELALSLQLLNRSTDRLSLPDRKPTLSRSQIRLVRQFLQAHLSQRITLDEMAGCVHLSRYHFARMFRQTMGLSPYRYLMNLRLDRAADLLLNRSNLPISQISLESGFADQSHLTKHFREKYGLTPAEFRLQYAF